VGHGVGRIQSGHDLTRSKHLYLEFVVGQLRHRLGENFGSAINRVERLREARRAAPLKLRHRLRNGGHGHTRGRGGNAGQPGGFEKFATFHGFPPQESWAAGAMLLPMYRFVITNNARVETLSIHSRVRHFGLVDRSSPGIRTINAAPATPSWREWGRPTK